MDQNKNWVNWKYFNPNLKLTIMSYKMQNHATNISETVRCDQSALYFVFACGHQNSSGTNPSIVSTGLEKFSNRGIKNDGKVYIMSCFLCNEGDTISTTIYTSQYYDSYVCAKVTGPWTNAVIGNYNLSLDNTEGSSHYTNLGNVLCFGLASGTSNMRYTFNYNGQEKWTRTQGAQCVICLGVDSNNTSADIVTYAYSGGTSLTGYILLS